MPIAFQDLLDAESTCFGCGPANPQGFRLKSTWSADRSAVVATHVAEPFHGSGFPNTMQGGAIATMLDCHLCWAVIAWAYAEEGREVGERRQDHLRHGRAVAALPAPHADRRAAAAARVRSTATVGRKMRAVGEIGDGTTVTATAEGLFVRVV